MQFTAATHGEAIGGVGVLNTQGDVGEQFPLQPVSQLAAGDKFARFAGKW